jgi:hypothetical protein
MGSGVFTAAGQAKAAWSKLTDGARPGDPAFTVEAADGWQPGDRIVLTPTAASATPDFTGARSPAITQDHDECDGGNDSDPNDSTCIRTWIRFENPRFVAGTVPFDFGGQRNKFALWEICGFSHPDYPALPASFDLYRKDNQVAGGSYSAAFDAWLVPR